MSELQKASCDLLGYSPAIVQPTQVSKEITRLEPQLLLYDNIEHADPYPHGGKAGRQHRFYYKHKEIKQQSLTI